MAVDTQDDLPPAMVTYIDDAAHLAGAADMDVEEARRIVDLLRRFTDDRANDFTLYVVTLDDWAYEEWSDYDVADNGVILASDLVDHSERAYRVEGGYEVVTDVLFGADDPSDQPLPTLFDRIDVSDTDYVDEPGVRFLPKTAVTGVYDLLEGEDE